MEIDRAFAEQFASDWFESWNSHDLNRILSHYREDFEFSSPVIVQIAKEPSGKLKGRQAVGAYWEQCLRLIPDLRFEFVNMLVGIECITLYYQGVRGMVAEVFFFDTNGKVAEAHASYESIPRM